jgi:hypothetical protein
METKAFSYVTAGTVVLQEFEVLWWILVHTRSHLVVM